MSTSISATCTDTQMFEKFLLKVECCKNERKEMFKKCQKNKEMSTFSTQMFEKCAKNVEFFKQNVQFLKESPN